MCSGFGDALGVQSFRKTAKRAFADADRAFDCYIPGGFKKVRHECEEVAIENIPTATLAQLRKKLTPAESSE